MVYVVLNLQKNINDFSGTPPYLVLPRSQKSKTKTKTKQKTKTTTLTLTVAVITMRIRHNVIITPESPGNVAKMILYAG